MASRGVTLILRALWFNRSSWIHAKEITAIRVYSNASIDIDGIMVVGVMWMPFSSSFLRSWVVDPRSSSGHHGLLLGEVMEIARDEEEFIPTDHEYDTSGRAYLYDKEAIFLEIECDRLVVDGAESLCATGRVAALVL
ncbi:hypothetical protein B296_00012927 [Ensete ventricosum]|uniref:Uncharacterized protein n=1 Tax=Ensete ventricosum TaxID=4639 RepID=A0A426X7N1_ENSVE|nr:hypothetical protein B296_00012927 [Ensete ventricosum]